MPVLKILLVEDNPMNLRLATDVLEVRGHAVTSAGDVDTALAALEDFAPDIALLDIDIPGGGGVHLLERMREDARFATLPCIAVTAFAMHGDRERLLAAGFDGYLSKPIDTRSFGPTVEDFARGVAPQD